MPTRSYPPLEIDDELLALVEQYRMAKRDAASATRGAAVVETRGHYDKDTPLQTRNAQEAETMNTERSIATRVADQLLAWVDKNR